LELLLTGSKMGLMRRGLATQLFQPKTWVRQSSTTNSATNDESKDGITTNDVVGEGQTDNVNMDDPTNDIKQEQEQQQQLSEQEKILQNTNLTPSQKAAQLLAAKQQKEEELKQMKRTIESAENAGRDPDFFSKRTAFDIQMDQIEEKPWDRNAGGTADITDYFNYGLSEEDWEEYSERQKMVRQELKDASRQKRNPDPTIVPVVPRAPSKQNPKVAVAVKKEKKKTSEDDGVVLGPSAPADTKDIKDEESNGDGNNENNQSSDNTDQNDDTGTVASKQSSVENGVWGIDVKPGSALAKLIEEQEKKTMTNDIQKPPPPQMHNQQDAFSSGGDYQPYHHNRNMPPPPPPSFQDHQQHFPPHINDMPPPHDQFHHGGGPFGNRGSAIPPPPYYGDGPNGGRGFQFGGRGRGDSFGGRGRGNWGNGPPPFHMDGRGGRGGRGGRRGGRSYMR